MTSDEKKAKEVKETKVALLICLIAFTALWGNYFRWCHEVSNSASAVGFRMLDGAAIWGESDIVP